MALTKALIINQDAAIPVPIPVMFNPPEYQLERSNEFASFNPPGIGATQLQFVRCHSPSLSMDLFFDTTDLGVDVRMFTDRIVGLMNLEATTHAPPRLLFVWGSLIFPCMLQSVSQQFDYFNAFGIPLRAKLRVSLQSYETMARALAKVPLESTDRAKRWLFKAGDSLQRIAAQEYGDPGQWRAIAEASGIDNPLTIAPGTSLIVPTITSG